MSCLRRDAEAIKKLFERDKFIALRAQHVDGLERGLDAGLIRIVEEDDVAGLRVVRDLIGDEIAVAHAPIHRVHGPIDHGDGDGGLERVARKAQGGRSQ